MSSSGDVNVFQKNAEWFFSRRVKFDSGFNVMAVHEISWHEQKIISCFTGIRKWVLKWLKWRKWRPFWFSKKTPFDFLLELGNPVSKWINSNFYASICDWKLIFHFLWIIASFALSLSEQISDASIVSNSSRSAINTSPFQIPSAYKTYPKNNPTRTFFPNWWILDWSFAVIGWYSTNEPNGMIGTLYGTPKRLS